jgi:hypothetical protein
VSSRLRNLTLFGTAWLVVLIAAASYWFTLQPVLADGRDQDFLFFSMGARIGLDHGWSHLYDLELQRKAFAQLRPGHPWDDVSRYINPPPLAWLIVPLAWLPAPLGYASWVALGLAALVGAWRLAALGTQGQRAVLLLAALAWYPVVVAVRTGQPSLLLLGLVALSWFLLDRGRPNLAGVALALTAIKPTAALLMGPALLVAGHRRAFLTWAATSALLAAASVALLGGPGVRQYLDALQVARGVAGAQAMTLRDVFPGEAATTAAQLGVAVLALGVAWWRRSGGAGSLYVVAILGSLLSATYLHAHDLPLLLLAFWLRLREGPGALELAVLAGTALSIELVNVAGPAPALASMAVWLVLSLRRSDKEREFRPEAKPSLDASAQLTSR